MSKSFNDIYNELYEKYGMQIDEIRKAVRKKQKIALLMYCIMLLLLVLAKVKYDYIILGSFFYLMASWLVIAMFSSNGNNVYKDGVIADLVKAVYPNSEYDYTRGISSGDYNSYAFGDDYDNYKSEDLVITNNAINLTFSEVLTEVRSIDNDGTTSYATSFWGIAGFCDLVKPLNTKIHITRNYFFGRQSKNNLRVDMPEFEKRFDVYAENKITAMGLLTADVMTEFLDIRKELGSMFELAIERDKIYFRIHTGKSFEMEPLNSSMKVKRIKKYYDLLCHIDKITQMINEHINELEI